MPGGRRPHVTVDTTPWFMGDQRLQPPACLSEAERRAFLDLVSTCPVGQFVASDLPLIARWCEATVQAEQAAAELHAHGMVTKGGKVSAWFTIHQQATKTMKDLALRLKLSPQSRHHKAPKTLPSRMTAYERLALEEGDDDEAAN